MEVGPRFSSKPVVPLALGLLAVLTSCRGTSKSITSEEPGEHAAASAASDSPFAGRSSPNAASNSGGRSLQSLPSDRQPVMSVEEWNRECRRRLNEADGSREKSSEARKWCNENQPPQEDPIMAMQWGVEQVSWEEMLEWWPYRPVLRASWLPRSGSEEVVFSLSSKRGRKGDPRVDHAAVYLVYQYPPSTVNNKGELALIADGAFLVQVYFYPPGSPAPYADPMFAEKYVVVRGHPAMLTEAHMSEGNNMDFRWVYWHEPAVGGGTFFWRIVNHWEPYTEAETIEFINRLDAII